MPVQKKILVVDNESGMRFLLKERFETLGISCFTAQDGKEAVEIALRERPSLIILDLIMPVMDGYETYQALKSDETTRNIPVIVYTAQEQESVMEQGLEAMDLVHFVLKPFDLAALSFLVQRTLNYI